ncbi:MAG: glycosyltransferase family 87 protein [Sphingomonadaceae bacterium]
MERVVDFLREARWLDSGRVRGYAVLIGIASLVIFALSYRDAIGPVGSDFLAFWGAGHVAAAGDPSAAYDLAVQQRVQTATASTNYFAFVNPPPFLFLATPFGMLPYPVAWLIWVVLGFALWAWVSIRAFPRLWVLVLIYPGALVEAIHGQTGFVTGAALVYAATRLDRHPMASGAAIGTVLIKPHLALLFPFWLAMGRRWLAFTAAAASVAILVLASWAAFGSKTMLAYPESWAASRAIMDYAPTAFLLRLSSVYAQARIYFGEQTAMMVAALVLLAMMIVALLAWRRFGNDWRGSGALVLAATGIASPYLFNYDLPFLVVPTLWLVNQGLTHGFRAYEKAVLVALYFAPFATRAAALPLGLNLMPFACVVLIWYVWSRGPEPDGLSESLDGDGGVARVM